MLSLLMPSAALPQTNEQVPDWVTLVNPARFAPLRGALALPKQDLTQSRDFASDKAPGPASCCGLNVSL